MYIYWLGDFIKLSDKNQCSGKFYIIYIRNKYIYICFADPTALPNFVDGIIEWSFVVSK